LESILEAGRVTKVIRGLGKFTYEERPTRCGLSSLEKRIKRVDLIEANKILIGKKAISAQTFFEISMKTELEDTDTR